MKQYRWQIKLGLLLIILSAVFYFLHFVLFHDAKHIFKFMIHEIAFVPIEVLLVTMILHQLLESRERKHKLEKLKMVIGVFFSEVGTRVLAYLSDADPQLELVKNDIKITGEWTDDTFEQIRTTMKQYDYAIDIKLVDLDHLKEFLISRRNLLLRLLENPTLLEHETFTELLRALFHLEEEMSHRGGFSELPDSDRQHIAGDIKRVYSHLVLEWIDYMEYLKVNYPFLFSLAVRTNPFDEKASVIVRT